MPQCRGMPESGSWCRWDGEQAEGAGIGSFQRGNQERGQHLKCKQSKYLMKRKKSGMWFRASFAVVKWNSMWPVASLTRKDLFAFTSLKWGSSKEGQTGNQSQKEHEGNSWWGGTEECWSLAYLACLSQHGFSCNLRCPLPKVDWYLFWNWRSLRCLVFKPRGRTTISTKQIIRTPRN